MIGGNVNPSYSLLKFRSDVIDHMGTAGFETGTFNFTVNTSKELHQKYSTNIMIGGNVYPSYRLLKFCLNVIDQAHY